MTSRCSSPASLRSKSVTVETGRGRAHLGRNSNAAGLQAQQAGDCPLVPVFQASGVRVGLYVEQGAAPAAPNPRQTDPEQPIERGQHWSFALSPKGSELQPECWVLDCNGSVTAQQKSNESNHKQ